MNFPRACVATLALGWFGLVLFLVGDEWQSRHVKQDSSSISHCDLMIDASTGGAPPHFYELCFDRSDGHGNHIPFTDEEQRALALRLETMKQLNVRVKP